MYVWMLYVCTAVCAWGVFFQVLPHDTSFSHSIATLCLYYVFLPSDTKCRVVHRRQPCAWAIFFRGLLCFAKIELLVHSHISPSIILCVCAPTTNPASCCLSTLEYPAVIYRKSRHCLLAAVSLLLKCFTHFTHPLTHFTHSLTHCSSVSPLFCFGVYHSLHPPTHSLAHSLTTAAAVLSNPCNAHSIMTPWLLVCAIHLPYSYTSAAPSNPACGKQEVAAWLFLEENASEVVFIKLDTSLNDEVSWPGLAWVGLCWLAFFGCKHARTHT